MIWITHSFPLLPCIFLVLLYLIQIIAARLRFTFTKPMPKRTQSLFFQSLRDYICLLSLRWNQSTHLSCPQQHEYCGKGGDKEDVCADWLLICVCIGWIMPTWLRPEKFLRGCRSWWPSMTCLCWRWSTARGETSERWVWRWTLPIGDRR